jgi:nucleotide-binding universal stress UspA family protein
MIKPFKKVLAPVYFDESSFASIEYAAHFAERNGGTVYLLHVVPTDEPHLLRDVYRPAEGGGANAEWAEKVSKELLQKMAADRLKGVRCEILTRVDSDAAKSILEERAKLDADLISMSTHGRTGLSRLVLRSVAERVHRESPCPVLTAQRKVEVSRQRPFQSILCPLDLDKGRLTSLRYAAALAKADQAVVHLLHIVPTENLLLRRDIYGKAAEGDDVVQAERVARQTLLEIAASELGGLQHDVHVHVSDDPARTILEMERDLRSDLLVMVTEGIGGLIHLIVGSVTETVIREGHCPVLSVRQGA